MASLLRCMKHLRPIINGSRPLITQLRTETWSSLRFRKTTETKNFILFSRCLTTRTKSIRRNSEFENDAINGMSKLDQILHRLDSDVRRVGRISINDVYDIVNEIKLAGGATSTQCLLIIRCCGLLLPDELPENRNKLLTTVLEDIKSLGIPLDVSHYNAILKVYLENEHTFSPTEFISEMDSKKVEPNRVTYQRLISYYCQQGDIDGASKILEFMKSKNLPINENVFNALIQGHSRVGDMENAKSIIEVMKSAKLEPTSETYTSLICGYAARGSIEDIRNAISEAESNDVSLTDKDLLEVIYVLAVNRHSEHIDEIVEKIRKQFGYNQDCINIIFRLINAKEDNTAFKVLLTMSRPSDTDSAPAGQFFIRHLVKNDTPVDKILIYCDELKRRNLNHVGLLRAVESSLYYQKPDHAFKCIEKLNEEGAVIRSHYFWPIINHYKSTNNVQGIYDTISKMCDLGCSPNFDTLLEYVYPNLDLNDLDAVIQKLKGYGLSLGAIVHPLVTHMLVENRLQTACKLVRTYPVRLMGTLVHHLTRAAVESRDLPAALQILRKINSSREANQEFDLSGQFIVDYYKMCDFSYQKLEDLLTCFKSNGFTIRPASADFVRSRMKDNVPTIINELLKELESEKGADSAEYVPNTETNDNLNEMSVKELESKHEELKLKNVNAKGVMRRLLILYCRQKNVSKALEMKSELDALDFVYSPLVYAALMDVYTYNNDMEKALECKKLIYDADQSFRIDDHKILNLAALMIKMGKYDEAVKILTEHHERNGMTDKVDLITRSTWRLLNAAAETGDPEMVQRFFDFLYSKGYITPTNMVLGALVKVHLIKNDIQGALQAFEDCCRKYNCTPWKNELLTQFIKLEDADRLQKVVDLSSEVHGEMNIMYDLAYTFISCNQFKQAKKILETPGLRARHQRLQSICEKFRDENKPEQLEQLINITKDLFDVDRDEMYYQLVMLYGELNEPAKALGVWTSMQEESVQPRNRTLIYLSNLLKKHNLSVPFAVPADEKSTIAPSFGSESKSEDIMTLIRNKQLDEALEFRRKMDNDITLRQSSFLIEALLQEERLNEAVSVFKELLIKKTPPLSGVLKFLLGKLSAVPDVDTIEHIGKQLSEDVKKTVAFNNYICRAFVNGNRSGELLQWLESGFPDNQTSFPNRGILTLLNKNPEYIDRVYNLAQSYASKGYLLPLNMMWVHFFSQENYEKADAIFKSTPEFKNKFIFIDIVRLSRETKNESMARKLVDMVKVSQMNEQLKCTSFSGLIDIQCDKNEIESALKSYEEAITLGLSPNSMKQSTLERLRNGLKALEKPLPASLTKQQPPQTVSSSDSSDSSDDEKDKRRR
ncbi:hypothetical protein CHUAL_003327 [Chamberlinius hualienensis]